MNKVKVKVKQSHYTSTLYRQPIKGKVMDRIDGNKECDAQSKTKTKTVGRS